VIYGRDTPKKSRDEMEGNVPTVQLAQLPTGKLAVYEEFPDAVVGSIVPFLCD
jgi:hypothetical protein